MRVCGRPTTHQHQPAAANTTIISQEPPVVDHPGNVLKRPERLGPPGNPRRCPARNGVPVRLATPASTARCLRLAAAAAANTTTVDSECVTGRSGLVSQQPEVKRYVIHIDGDRCDERRDVEAARRVDEARQHEQAKGCGGQMGDLIDEPGGPHAERESCDRPRPMPARPRPAAAGLPTTRISLKAADLILGTMSPPRRCTRALAQRSPRRRPGFPG